MGIWPFIWTNFGDIGQVSLEKTINMWTVYDYVQDWQTTMTKMTEYGQILIKKLILLYNQNTFFTTKKNTISIIYIIHQFIKKIADKLPFLS